MHKNPNTLKVKDKIKIFFFKDILSFLAIFRVATISGYLGKLTDFLSYEDKFCKLPQYNLHNIKTYQ